MAHELALIQRELAKEKMTLTGFDLEVLDRLTPDRIDEDVLEQVEASLQTLTHHYRTAYKDAERLKEARIAELTGTPEARRVYFDELDRFRNESLTDLVTNKNDVHVIVEYEGELIQKNNPIYLEPMRSGFFGAQFYAPSKWLFGMRLPTVAANVLVLWGMVLILGLTLYYEAFPKLMKLFQPRAGG